jgi:hypothetical protein
MADRDHEERSMRLRLPLIVALVVLAGCGGVLGDDGGSSDVETVTPAPVPTDEPTPTPVPQLAPGLTGQGIENASALAAAHEAALRNRSFTSWTNYTIRYRNGTLYRRSNASVRVAGGGRGRVLAEYKYGQERANESRFARYDIWIGDERAVSALTYTNGTTTYRNETSVFVTPRVFTRIAGLGATKNPFNGSETRIIGKTMRNGIERYRVAIREPSVLPRLPGLERSQSRVDGTEWTLINATAVIDANGLVREFDMTYAAETESGGDVEVTYTVRRSAIGNTTTERPPWYDEAVAATNATTGENPTTYR